MKLKLTPLTHSRQAFLEWYHVTTLGQTLQTVEASYLRSALKLTYNQNTLQVGHLGSETLYIDPDLRGGFVLIDKAPSHGHLQFACGEAGDLPIANSSIDTLILPHVIEFEANRHQVLREVERVLKPEGRLFLLGLNPWSMLGLLQHFPRIPSSLWHSRLVSSHRLLDWLSLLKFDAELSAAFSLSSATIVNSPVTAGAKIRAAVSVSYAVKAIKRRYTLIPIEPKWLNVPTLATGNMFENSLLNQSVTHGQ